MSAITYMLLFAMQISLIFSGKPRISTRCGVFDSGCFTRQVQLNVPTLAAGITELGTEVLDPMRIDFGRVDLAGLKLDIKNAVVRGFGSTVIDSASINPFLKQVHLVYHTDLTMDSLYKSGGSLFGLPISGDGNIRIVAKNVQIDGILPFDIVNDASGRHVIELKGFQYGIDFKDNVHFDLTNLFNGNKKLSDSMHQFLNTNWKIISLTFSRPLFEIANEKFFKALKTNLLAQPLDEAFLF